MADLVERFSVQGDHVLDPFCGAGTTGVVALALNRRFTGIDVDAEAVEVARRRLANGK
jgi:site-specific DNA-methyltransferase (adenine-specific)